MYARDYEGGLMVGWFEPEAKPAFEDSYVPKDWQRHLKTEFQYFCKYLLSEHLQNSLNLFIFFSVAPPRNM